MRSNGNATLAQNKLLCGVAICAIAINSMMPITVAAQAAAGESGSNDANTTTPIQHVIVIIGENRTFDHLFATYQPVNDNESVLNLLSEKIVNADGTPGPNYSAGTQNQAMDTSDVQQTYLNSPPKTSPYTTLPPPFAGGGYTQTINGQSVKGQPPFLTVAEAVTYENGLPPGYYKYLTTGAVNASILGQPDIRIYYNGKDVNNLPPGPYQLTGPLLSYDDYAESPVHRFYQMWQQLDCTAAAACLNDLFPWVEATVGAGSNGDPPPATSLM
jgi:phospholipase C